MWTRERKTDFGGNRGKEKNYITKHRLFKKEIETEKERRRNRAKRERERDEGSFRGRLKRG